MHRRIPRDPPFDPRWLELLVDHCGQLDDDRDRLAELYLERRLELRVSHDAGGAQIESCSSDGAAMRFADERGDRLHAVTGSSPQALAALLASRGGSRQLAVARPLPPPELDAPRGWLRWAVELVERAPGARLRAILIRRRAAVVRADGWRAVDSPGLVRVVTGGAQSTALLAVWNHPSLGRWLQDLVAPPPSRCWRPPSAGRGPVLFSNGTAGALLHELIGHLCEADLLLRGESPLVDLFGSTLTTSSLQVVDDPTRTDLPGGFTTDDEGTEAAPITLVERGRLCGVLCDITSSRRLGLPPGRGRRSAWNQAPMARMSNLVVAAGEEDPAAMERDVKRGLVVTRIAGASVDPRSGQAVIHVERGFELRGGRRRRDLAACNLCGRVLDILRAVDPGIGNDPTPDWRLGWCVKDGAPLATGSEAPTILIRELEVL